MGLLPGEYVSVALMSTLGRLLQSWKRTLGGLDCLRIAAESVSGLVTDLLQSLWLDWSWHGYAYLLKIILEANTVSTVTKRCWDWVTGSFQNPQMGQPPGGFYQVLGRIWQEQGSSHVAWCLAMLTGLRPNEIAWAAEEGALLSLTVARITLHRLLSWVSSQSCSPPSWSPL